ncbi:MAG: PAS domain S-box protein [Verrucomicrobia bacterium]|nr:PAS domain S-box protein [Verrucomicrobiota bacterium]
MAAACLLSAAVAVAGLFVTGASLVPGGSSPAVVAVAPSSAALIIGLAAATLVWLRFRSRRGVARGCRALMVACVLVAAFLAVRNSQFAPSHWYNTTPWFEARAHLGKRVSLLAPLTGLYISLAGLVLVGLTLGPRLRSRLDLAGRTVAALLCLTGFASVVGQAAGVPWLMADVRFSVAAGSALALTFLSFAAALGFGLRAWLHHALLDLPMAGTPAELARDQPLRAAADVGIAVIAVTLAATGYFYLSTQSRERHERMAADLSSIAELRAAQYAAWERERLSDLSAFARTPHLADALAHPEDPARIANFRPYFATIVANHAFHRLSLYDATFNPRLVIPEAHLPPLPASLRQLVAASHEPLPNRDLRSRPDALELDLIAPVWMNEEQFCGAIRLSLDLQSSILPQLTHWPTASGTGEILLLSGRAARPDYLGGRRFDPVPEADGQITDEVAGRILASRAPGLIEGLDYRREPVLAVARPVPGTDWLLVAKIDRREALAPLITEQREFFLGFGLVAVASGFALVYLWRNRQGALKQREAQAELARRDAVERLGLVLQQANDVVLLVEGDGRIVEANDRAAAVYGYTPGELRQLTIHDLRSPGHEPVAPEPAAARDAAGHTYETVSRRKDGSLFAVEASARSVTINNRPHVLLVVRDISQRKQHEAEIERLNGMYLALTRIGQAIIHARSEAELFEQVCRALVEHGRFKVAWFGREDPSTRQMIPQASAGDDHGYLDGIRLSTDPSQPEGRGPSGIAYREGRIVTVNDFFAQPETQPWRARAARSGIQASICLPVRRGTERAGVLTVYAGERNFFGPREVNLLTEAVNDVSFALEVLASDRQRRQVEAELRKLSAIVEQSPVSIVVTNPVGEIEYVNPRLTEVTGYLPEEVRGRNPRIFKSGRNPPELYTQLWQTITAGHVWRGELVNQRKDGSLHSEFVVIAPISGAAGGIGHFVALKEDITERKRIEASLRESEERFRLIAESTADLIWLGDLESGRYLYVSQSARVQRGFDPAEMVGRPMADFQAPETQAALTGSVQRRLAALAAGDESARHAVFEATFLRKDGTKLRAEVSSTIMTDASGRLTRLLGITRDISTRIRAESDLRKMSRTLEQAPLSIVITDLAGRIEFVNPAFTRVSGYTFDEVRGRNPRILKAGITPAAVYREMWQALTAGQVWRGELHNRKKSGEVYVELAVIAPVLDPSGRATHYVALKEDVTEANRVHHALRHSEERFRAIFDHVSMGMFETTPDGRVARANRHLADMLGTTTESLVGAHWSSFLATPGPQAQAEPPPTQPSELSLMRRDGQAFWGLITGQRELGSEERTLGYICLLQDISAQVEAREKLLRFNAELEAKVAVRTAELASRNSQYQALLQSIPDIVMRLRPDGTVLHYQRAKEVGAHIIAALGSSSLTDPPGRLIEISRPLGRQALESGHTVTAEHEVAPDSHGVTLELRAAPSGGDEFVVFVRDVTERRRLEAETAAMLERERQVSDMKSRFVAVTSHEFRTPMAAAIGSAELLAHHLERLSPDKRQELFDRITSSLRRMTEMLDDLLTLNRMEAHRLEPKPVALMLEPLVRSLVDEVRVGDHETHPFEVRCRGLNDPVTSDPNLLRPILSNLLSNAVRYSPPGTLVTVTLLADERRFQLSVQDRGIGIPPADRDRVFEPFERASNVGSIKGTGLGLSIVKRMTELLGGTVAIDAPEETGIRFTLTFPRHGAGPHPHE